VDKDVMLASDAVVNWDSGHLRLTEVEMILDAFREAAQGRLIGCDTTGDRSPVVVSGLMRRILHWTEHESLPAVDDAAQRNGAVNRALLSRMVGDPHATGTLSKPALLRPARQESSRPVPA
jgi:hypothetical protein